MKGVLIVCIMLITFMTLSGAISSVLFMGGGIDWVAGTGDEVSSEVLGYNVGYLLNYQLENLPIIFEQGLRYKTRGSMQEDFYTTTGIMKKRNEDTRRMEDFTFLDQAHYSLNETLHYLDILVRLKLDLASEYGVSFQPFVGLAPSILLFSDAKEGNTYHSKTSDFYKNGMYEYDEAGDPIYTETTEKISKTRTKDMRDFRSGVNIVLLSGLDIQINRSLSIGLEFDFGLSNINKKVSEEDAEEVVAGHSPNSEKPAKGPTLISGRMLTRSMMLNVGYKFGF